MPDSLSKSQLNFSSVYSMHTGAGCQTRAASFYVGRSWACKSGFFPFLSLHLTSLLPGAISSCRLEVVPTRRADFVPVEGVGCYLPLIYFGCTDPHADLSSQEQQHWAEVEKLANRDLVPMGHSGAGVGAWRQETHWEDWHLPSRIWLLCSVLRS